MSIQKNINNNLDDSFKNNNFLPKKILLEDVDRGMRDYIKDLRISVEDGEGLTNEVPIIFLTQEIHSTKVLVNVTIFSVVNRYFFFTKD